MCATQADVSSSTRFDVVSATAPCQDLSKANARKRNFDGPKSGPHFITPHLIEATKRVNPRVLVFHENVVKDDDVQEKDNFLCGGLPAIHVGGRLVDDCIGRERRVHSTFPPADDAPVLPSRALPTYQHLLDDLYGSGVYEAKVRKLECFKASTKPNKPVKTCLVTHQDEPVAIQEALHAMGFPVDWFDAQSLDDADMWRLLGNSINVRDIEVFYKSLTRVFQAGYCDARAEAAAKERTAAVHRFRATLQDRAPAAADTAADARSCQWALSFTD